MRQSYEDVIRLFADRGVNRKETDDGTVYLEREGLEIVFPAGTPFDVWVEMAMEFFDLDPSLDLLRDPKDDD